MREGPRSNRASFYGLSPGPSSPWGRVRSGELGTSEVQGSPEKDRAPAARRIAVASLIAVWLAFTFPLFTGKVHFPTDFAGPRPAARGEPRSNPDDGDAYFALYPWHAYLGAQLRTGHLPMWDPSRFGGAPYAANPSMGAFYPLNWLYAAGHTLLVETLVWAVTILASLLLSYWFLRLLTLHPYAAALGAVTWTFSGFMTGWGTSDPVLGAAVWLPLALGGLELARRGRPRWGVPLAGLGLALSVLAGRGGGGPGRRPRPEPLPGGAGAGAAEVERGDAVGPAAAAARVDGPGFTR